ncbi:MAG: cytochrome P450 [Burkholderiales bacterium]|jgi:hypothetical protein|nr:cytochrome P450 [Burkholderiales bacterium]
MDAPFDARAAAAQFDLARLPDGFHDDPYRWYAALREHAPVKRMADGAVLVTRYADALAIYRDPVAFSSDKQVEFGEKYGTGTPLHAHHTTSLIFNDPPYHTRVRRLISGALTPHRVAAMEPGVVALVDRLLDAMPSDGVADLIDGFAAAIPIEVIGNLLRVPHAERGPLRAWSLAILGALEPVLGADAAAAGHRAVTEFLAYLEGLVADRRAHPGDPDVDVLTRLIQGEDDGERLTAAELLHNCVFLLNAGHETTTNLIGNGLELLARHPEACARLRADPGLIGTTVEECLRFESSNQLGNRMATRAVDVGGVALPAGTRITLCIGSANRDPAQFDDPERFDIARQPNRHLSFASGPHTCVGLQVARLEGRVAIERFVARFRDFGLAAAPVRGGRVRFRGFLHLPMRLRAA